MKIRKLHIKNYKVFDDIELDFTDANGKTLDKIVLAGVNGCGKTTILDIVRKLFDTENYRKEFSKAFIEVEFEFSEMEILVAKRQKFGDEIINFPFNNKYLTLKYNSNEALTVRHSLSNFFELNRNSTDYFLNKLLYFPTKKVESLKNTVELIYLDSLKESMKELAIKGVREEIFKNKNITLSESIERGIKKITKGLEVINLKTKLVDLESDDLVFESANGQKVRFEDLSNGEQNLYFRAIYLSQQNPQNSIIMIDEPEDSLHPTWQQKVMQLYQNIGENNQVIVATHSPHIIGSSKAEEVFLLQIDENKIEARHPRYTKGHSIDYVLDEIMGANSRDTSVIKLVDSYLALMRKGQHESAEGLKIKSEIDALNLDPNSEEMRGLNLSIKRIKAVGV
jgi:predicted ATP-binding protein involved in virulence